MKNKFNQISNVLVKELVAVMSCFNARQLLCCQLNWIRFVKREGWKPVKGIMYMLKVIFEPHYYKTGAERK